MPDTSNPPESVEKPPEFGPFDALLFDMGDVLYDATLWRRWLWRLLSKLGIEHGYHALFSIWDDEYLDTVHRGQAEYAPSFEAFLARLKLSRAQIDEVVAASRIRKRELEADARPLAGVRPTIERLAAIGTPLGVVSDSESRAEDLREYLNRLGLGAAFSVIVSSRDLGCTKPDPRCYLTALDALGISAECAAFVGHDAVELAGARAVGLTSVAFNEPAGCDASIHLTQFRDLLAFVRPAQSLAGAR
jgi:HAD superfamily hydrolase (TIGR01509 family)